MSNCLQRETRPRVAAARLEYRNGTMLGDMPTTGGRVPVQKASAQIRRPRANRREGPSSVLVTSQWHAQESAGQPARTAWAPYRHPSQGSS
eukprot:scaffold54137_cov67-Phaeocystis_antarctica.AAC.6